MDPKPLMEILCCTYLGLCRWFPDYGHAAGLKKHIGGSGNMNLTLIFGLVRNLYESRSYGQRAFSTASPTLWNKLPPHIKDSKTIEPFKVVLKKSSVYY